MKLVDELKWRGMIHDIMPGTEELLNSKKISGYVGFDPTANSLHIGNLVPIMLLVHLQRSGHNPIALIGGATGMVGDPSGKSQERNLLDAETLAYNIAGQKKQLLKFLDFEGENKAELVNNYDWFKEFSFLDFIRDVGKHMTINYMMAKDSVKTRLETGLSFTEFSYQLVQGYDFYHLWKNNGCLLQMGGSDQWGNITTGTELIRRMEGGEAFALTAPLLKRSDGKKFGKSEGGNIWLDKEKTSPFKFYQYWLNVSDEDAGKMMRIFTLKNQAEIETLEAEHAQDPGRRILQKELAKDVTIRVHSEADFESAILASKVLFGKSTTEDLEAISERDFLSIFEGVGQMEIPKKEIENGIGIIDALSEKTNFLKSKGEARRDLKQNAISVNKRKVNDNKLVDSNDLINDKYILLQKGKKNFFIIKAI